MRFKLGETAAGRPGSRYIDSVRLRDDRMPQLEGLYWDCLGQVSLYKPGSRLFEDVLDSEIEDKRRRRGSEKRAEGMAVVREQRNKATRLGAGGARVPGDQRVG